MWTKLESSLMLGYNRRFLYAARSLKNFGTHQQPLFRFLFRLTFSIQYSLRFLPLSFIEIVEMWYLWILYEHSAIKMNNSFFSSRYTLFVCIYRTALFICPTKIVRAIFFSEAQKKISKKKNKNKIEQTNVPFCFLLLSFRYLIFIKFRASFWSSPDFYVASN